MTNMRPKVFVALSGGVDSAVSAYLLQRRGYDVRGVFMKNWTGTHDNLAGECNWVRERDDAEVVAKRLKIPFAVWDFERDYRRLVIDHFFREYARGRTPNPDVRCNQYVKIPLFLKRALKEGASYIATGHYARIQGLITQNRVRDFCPAGQKSRQQEQYRLYSGLDAAKDQSYFLYTLTQTQLKHLLFPVGELTKPEVRAIAARAKLPVAEKPDSQGICFVGEVKVEDFLRTRLPEKLGTIVDTKGRPLGQHKGLAFYTLGQRHGLGLAGGPWYVVGRKWRQNVLIVGKINEQQRLMARTFTVMGAHWVAGKAPSLPATFLVRHRYRAPLVPARVLRRGRELTVTCQKAQRAITPGQAAVFYTRIRDGLLVVGGGTIGQVEKPGLLW